MIITSILEPDAKVAVLFAEDLGRVILAAVKLIRGLMPHDGGEGADPGDDTAEVVRSLPAGVESTDAA